MASTRKIVVVDDSETSRRFARLILERAGYDVVTVESAFEIMSVVRSSGPSLVLIDVTMPGLQGDKAVEILLRHRSLEPIMTRKRLPEPLSGPYRVVLYSSKEERELQRLALHCGADGYIRKSPDVARFLEQVQSFAGPPRRA